MGTTIESDWENARLAEENARLRDAVAWRPIATAPKDGTHILLYVGEGAAVNMTGGFWDDHPKCRCWIAGGYMRKRFPPTHWMPLPEAPNV